MDSEKIIKCPNCYEMNYFDNACSNCQGDIECQNCNQYDCYDCNKRLSEKI